MKTQTPKGKYNVNVDKEEAKENFTVKKMKEEKNIPIKSVTKRYKLNGKITNSCETNVSCNPVMISQ